MGHTDHDIAEIAGGNQSLAGVEFGLSIRACETPGRHRSICPADRSFDLAGRRVAAGHALGIEALEAANVPCGPINNMKEVFEDPQVQHRALRVDIPHPLGGTAPVVRSPLRLSETPVEYRLAPPTLGQHNEEILKGLLGRSDADLKQLKAAGIV